MARVSSSAFVQQAVQDLNAIGAYVQQQIDIGRDAAAVMSVQCDALNTRLRNLGQVIYINTAEATMVTAAISAGPWSVDQKRSLAATVDAALAAAASGPTKRAQQSCMNYENFQTPSEWKSLRAVGPLRSAKCSQVASRYWSISITCSQETSVFRMAALSASRSSSTSRNASKSSTLSSPTRSHTS